MGSPMGASLTSVTSTPDQAHIQKMLAQCAAASDGIHNSAFSDLQFF